MFLLYFAHHITFDRDLSDVTEPALASRESFENERFWHESIISSRFETCYGGHVGDDVVDELQNTAESFCLGRNRTDCFLMANRCQVLRSPWRRQQYHLSLFLHAPSNLQEQVPDIVGGNRMRDDFKAMERGIGKVFRHGVHPRMYQLTSVAESFTEYLIQFMAVIITVGNIPTLDEIGYNDLTGGLPRAEGIQYLCYYLNQRGGTLRITCPYITVAKQSAKFPSWSGIGNPLKRVLCNGSRQSLYKLRTNQLRT